jgi:Peptidase inhibitor family I36
MRSSARRVVSAVAATAVTSLGLTGMSGNPASASGYEPAAAPCPAAKVCLYDGADFTGLLLVTDENSEYAFARRYDNKVSSIVNNNAADLWLFTEPGFDGRIGAVPAGTRWVVPAAYDNQISSMYLY